jgi:TPR repeat protein
MKSATQGYALAELALAENVVNTNGIAKDYAIAAKLFRAAAEQGDPQAMSEYAKLLDAGLGVTKDTTQAAAWYERAAQCGVATAMQSLAGYLYAGIGTAREPAKAYYWAQLALHYYRNDSMESLTRVPELRNQLLPAIDKIVSLQARQQMDGQIAVFKPKSWSVPAPPLVTTINQPKSEASAASF